MVTSPTRRRYVPYGLNGTLRQRVAQGQSQGSFRGSARDIVESIEEDWTRAAWASATDLAKVAGCEKSTLSRFIRQMGYSDYTAFQFAARDAASQDSEADIGSQKTGFRHDGPLHKNLTPYLDALITRGGKKAFWPEYALRCDTPFFGTLLNEPLSSRTLAAGFKVATGHGPHIVRTLVHDALAAYGDYGSVMAMVLCGQISPATAKDYEIHAQRHRIARGQEQLMRIQEGLLSNKNYVPKKLFGPRL